MVRAIWFQLAIVALACSVCFSQSDPPPSPNRVPILVELFTSEGCSSCPPADRLVQSLDTQPLSGVEIIVLSEHVDYWDQQGWRDPYSSPEFSERQRVYARQFSLADVYTPQLVVDGSRQMSGNDPRGVEAALREARTRSRTELRITGVTMDQARLHVHVESAPFQLTDVRGLDVYLVIALNHAESQVTRGENANRRLTHAAVVRKIMQIGKVKAGERFSRDIEVKIQRESDPLNLRIVAFLQDSKSRRVFGAAMTRVGQPQLVSVPDSSARSSP